MSTDRTAAETARPDRPERVPWRAVAVFVGLACALAWLVAMPLWLVGSEASAFMSLFAPLAGAMMFTPTLAVLVVVFLMKAPRGERMRFLGMWPLRPTKRLVSFAVAMNFAPVLIVAACIGVSALFGWVQLDLAHFSGYRQTIDAQLESLGPETAEIAASSLPPVGALIGIQLAVVMVGGFLNLFPALGEELGWRGWLLPMLRPLGVWPALLLTGAIWGLWHSPVILLGYNFNRTDWSGVALMTVGCVLWGVFFGWLRLRTGSVWPAVLGHGSLNASAGMIGMFAAATDAPPDMALVNPLGVPGWIVLAIIVLVLLVTGQFGPEPELAPARPKRYPAPGAPPSRGDADPSPSGTADPSTRGEADPTPPLGAGHSQVTTGESREKST